MNAEALTRLDELCLPEEAFCLRADLPPGVPFELINIQLERLGMVLDVVRMEYIRGERTYSDVGLCVLIETAQSMIEGVRDLVGHGSISMGRMNREAKSKHETDGGATHE